MAIGDDSGIIKKVEVCGVGFEAPERGLNFWQRLASLQAPWEIIRDLRKNTNRVILDDVSCSVSSGEMLAIMGGSGSGKTSLLDIIGFRCSGGKITGNVHFNGQKASLPAVTSQLAYVRQDDRLLPHLTVKETLTFVAHLKMGRMMEKDQINKRVESVIMELGLRHVADTKVGGETVRGVSGGERRRVSIGFQLLQNPSVLLLDEPTSGLDSFTAHHLVETLQDVARVGRVVILSIHQPRSDIFELFDKLLLLAQGHTVFLGDPRQMVTYFTNAGYPCPELTNPCDFYIDKTTVDPSSDESREQSEKTIAELARYYNEHKGDDVTDTATAEACNGITPASSTNSINGHVVVQGTSVPRVPSSSLLLDQPTGKAGASMAQQFVILLRRAMANKIEDYWSLSVQALQAVAMSILIGLVFFQLKKDQPSVRDRFGMLYIIGALYPYMVVVDVIAQYHRERRTLYHEIQDGLYSHFPYYAVKLVSEIPEHTVFTTLYILPVYFMSGLQLDARLFFQAWAIVYILVYCSRSLAMAGAAVFPSYQLSALFVQLVFTMFLLATGYIFNLNSIFVGVRWISQISYLRYGFQSLCLTEMPGLNFTCAVPLPGLCFRNGQEALEAFAMGDGEVWHGVVVIGIKIFIFLVCFFLSMRFISQKPHQD